MLRIFLALWLALTPAFAWAGSMSLLGVGTVNAAIPGPPTFTFQNASVDTSSSGADVTFTSSLSAPASANRFVAVMVGQPDSGVGYTVNSATFNAAGTPVTAAVTQIGTSNGTRFFMITGTVAANISGSNITLDVILNNTNFFSPFAAFYTADVTTLISTTPSVVPNSITSGASQTASIPITTAGSAILMSWESTTNSLTAVAISASDAGLSTDFAYGAFAPALGGHANNVGVSAASHVTVSWTGTVGTGDMALAAFR